MTRTITNDVPEVLLEVAREAIGLGFSEVNLGFMYLGSDFPSPIEWALMLLKRTNRHDAGPDAPRVHVRLSAQREDSVPTAYVGPYDALDPYWSVDQVRAWMQESVEADGEYIPAWTPVTDETVQKQLLTDWGAFREGVLSGWTMKHEARWNDLRNWQNLENRVSERDGRDARQLGPVPGTSLHWDSSNSFYNEKKHPAYRGKKDDGAPVSVGGHSTRAIGFDNGSERRMYRQLNGHPYMAEISAEEMAETLQATAPWFVRVAGYDEDREKWAHFPEAKAWKKNEEGMAAAVADTERALAICAVLR
ncbi:hypothetical protein ACFVAJ_17620 [Agromyces sp. NPDC057679]|uniref:hypothetical protein n=1 Tax=Agromyces sp. NPDC057679 TaxID=3346207 RepID=UPI00366BA14E